MILMPVATLERLSHHLNNPYMPQPSLSSQDIPPQPTHILTRLLRVLQSMLRSPRTPSSAELPQQAKPLSSHKGMPHRDMHMMKPLLQLALPFPPQKHRHPLGNQVLV